MHYEIKTDGINWTVNRFETKPVTDKKTGDTTNKEVKTLVGHWPKLHFAGMGIYEDACKVGYSGDSSVDGLRNLTAYSREMGEVAVLTAAGVINGQNK